MSVVRRVAGGAGVGLGLGRPAPQRLCVGHQEPPRSSASSSVDEEMLSSHLRSFDQYGPIVQMGKPRF